jgi:hypothetical protein
VRGRLFVILLGILAGCSMHPLPDDISPLPTEEIVRNMRCEVKTTVRDIIREALDELAEKVVDPAMRDAIYRVVPDDVMDPANLRTIASATTPESWNAGVVLATRFVVFSDLTMAYTFEFNIQELNSAVADTTFFMPFLQGGGLTLNANGGLTKLRQANRVFSTVETFADLRDLNCRDFVVRDGNLIYPITGSIGMGKVIRTFVELTKLGGGASGGAQPTSSPSKKAGLAPPETAWGLGMNNGSRSEGSATKEAISHPAEMEVAQATAPTPLPDGRQEKAPAAAGKTEAKKKPEAKKPEAKKTEAKKPEAKKPEAKKTEGGGSSPATPSNLFTDTLTFTTTWNGRLNPHLEVAPFLGQFRMIKGDLDLNGSRTDLHRVTISLTFPDFREYKATAAASLATLAKAQRKHASQSQALRNLCIARARSDEQTFKTLRLYSPEMSCSLTESGVGSPIRPY